MTKDVVECIKGRRSIRQFSEEPVMDATVGRLLESAVMAPSAGNRQPWFFYVVKSAQTRKELVGAAYGQGFIAQAPVVIVVCANPERSAARYGERGRVLYCLQDTAAAVQNILLTAYAHGLGTCWIGAFDEEAVRKALNIPDRLRPVALIPVGHPAEERQAPPRKAVEEVVEIIEK